MPEAGRIVPGGNSNSIPSRKRYPEMSIGRGGVVRDLDELEVFLARRRVVVDLRDDHGRQPRRRQPQRQGPEEQGRRKLAHETVSAERNLTCLYCTLTPPARGYRKTIRC